MPWALPMAGAKQSMPVKRMKSSATSSAWVSLASSLPMPSSTPRMGSISPSTAAPSACASTTISAQAARLSATLMREPSNRTDCQPWARQALMSARSGQWSRWRATGTGTSRAISWNIAYRTRMPMDWTVLTDVWTMSGASAAVAAASTASMVRSLTILMAATP